MITQELLKERYDYDPLTGHLTNRYRIGPTSPEGAEAGCMMNNGYRAVRINKTHYQVHRIVWMYVYGELPKGNIDHINHIRDDNRIDNLRDVSQSTNLHNKEPGKVGCKRRKNGKYTARIIINKVDTSLGTYNTQEEAYQAYLEKKLSLQPTQESSS